jgi:hypothetical protein
MNSEEGQKMLDYYHEELLQVVATTTLWHPDLRLLETISAATNPFTGESSITPSTEAILVTYFKNGGKKWKKMVEEEATGGKLDRAEAEKDCPFTSSKGGQQVWGGWNEEGREFFKNMVKKIEQARQQDHVEEMEAGILERIQTKHAKKARQLGKRKRKSREEENDDGRDEFGY